MHRNKKIILLSHCLLNVNSKVNNIANYEGVLKELAIPLIEKNYGFIQLPCPETLHCGLKRWGQVKEQFETPYFKEHCKNILAPFISQIIDYFQNGYEISACIGVDGSPSCGVNSTCRSKQWGVEIDSSLSLEKLIKSVEKVEEEGVFIEVFKKLLDEHKIDIKFLAIDEANPKNSIENLLKELR